MNSVAAKNNIREITSGNQPLIRWAGSKRQAIPTLLQYCRGTFDRYVEPFVGSACLYFALSPKQAVLSDLNAELITAYKIIRRSPAAVWEALQALPANAETYYELRAKSPAEMTQFSAAVRFLYLNRFCFNGLYRTNQLGHFNVPYASSGTGAFPSRELFITCGELLRTATLRTCDFEEVLRDTRKGDLVYMDPPYALSNRRVFKEYGKVHFATSDLRRLGAAALDLDSRGVKFIISYAESKEARECLSKWPRRRILARRNIAGFAKNRRTAYELLFSNLDL